MKLPAPTALIAEDEALLAQALQTELARAWPALQVLGVAADGKSATAMALDLLPDVLFFDIHMPGPSGLQAATELADAWPDTHPFPALVFVTAYDEYALQAFEAQAVDYVLKPVATQRLLKTVSRVQQVLAARAAASAEHLQATLNQLRGLLAANTRPAVDPPLQFIQVGVGNAIRLLPLEQVLYFEAADKYVRVVSTGRADLIRTPLKDLLLQLDARAFWQVHRGTVVRAAAIEQVLRDAAGRLSLQLRGCPERLAVSRLYAHLFKAM